MIARQATSISTDIRLRIDALVDVLELRARTGRSVDSAMVRNERRSRRH
jgi:hypothetical protein